METVGRDQHRGDDDALNWQVSKITARTLWVAIVIGCGMMLTIWTAAPAIVSRMGAKADVAACVHSSHRNLCHSRCSDAL